MGMKVLCKICHDKYSDEEYSFGRCCGFSMVQVPQKLYDQVSRDRHAVNKLISSHGKNLLI